MAKYEYLLKTWGGFYNYEHFYIHNHKPGYYWFNTSQERDDYIQKLREIELKMSANYLMIAIFEGYDTRLKTIVKVIYSFNGKEYNIEIDFGYCYNPESAKFMFDDGNYACDCNRSILIRKFYSEFDELKCGESIEIKNFEVIQSIGCENITFVQK